MTEIADTMTIALAQLNPLVGDLRANAQIAGNARREATGQGADLIVFSELFITGYPPEDLILKPAFIAAARQAIETLATETGDGGSGVLIGAPWAEDGDIYNSLIYLDGGGIEGVRHKVELPNYGVFDEKRLFASGPMPGPLNVRGVRIGAPICEDIWNAEVAECLVETGAELFIVPNGSPYSGAKFEARLNHAVARVAETGLPLAYVNQMGGQDELVFDGSSFVLDADSSLALQMPAWEEGVAMSTWRCSVDGWRAEKGPLAILEEGDEAHYLACVAGLRDYVTKNGFPSVVLGLSGGVDSALTAAIAVDALGPDKVHCVMLPYRYTSAESLSDAAQTAANLGCRYDVLAIGGTVEELEMSLKPLFEGSHPDVTEENIQSRVRGMMLMAISNKFGSMVVTTGNKSEVSVGYATLYGDMAGGFNPIKDLYKTQVYALSRLRNGTCLKGCLGPEGAVIPLTVLNKPPSAELKADQTDQDTLPSYDVLDDILECLVEKEMPLVQIASRGHAAELVSKIETMLYVAEFKRRQAAPGVKISSRNFGRGRRYPITNKFRETF